jgi:hypothetical protein
LTLLAHPAFCGVGFFNFFEKSREKQVVIANSKPQNCYNPHVFYLCSKIKKENARGDWQKKGV